MSVFFIELLSVVVLHVPAKDDKAVGVFCACWYYFIYYMLQLHHVPYNGGPSVGVHVSICTEYGSKCRIQRFLCGNQSREITFLVAFLFWSSCVVCYLFPVDMDNVWKLESRMLVCVLSHFYLSPMDE